MFDICVVDYGTPELARACVASLTSPLIASIEVVDAKARGLSYAQAVNRSLAARSSEYVLALNADTRMLRRSSLDTVRGIFQSDADIAAVGPLQIDRANRITHAGIVGTNTRPEHRFWLQPLDQVHQECSERVLDCVTVSGAVYFARRTVWEELGGFSDFPLYYEETAFSYRARHRGHRVVYTGATVWEHLWNSSPADPEWKTQTAARSRQMFLELCASEGIEA